MHNKQVNPQFTYTGMPQDAVSIQGKSFTRNNIQNESQQHENRDNFNGDTGHDYNIQQQEEYTRRQNALTANNTGQSLGGSQSKSRGRQNANNTKSSVIQGGQYT